MVKKTSATSKQKAVPSSTFTMQFACSILIVFIGMILYTYQQEGQHFLQLFTSPPVVGPCQASDYLTTVMDVEGFHVGCISKESSSSVHIVAFLKGRNNSVEFNTEMKMDSFRKDSQVSLHMKSAETEIEKKYKQKWRIFTTNGKVITSMSALLTAGTFFYLEGGQFVWPGVSIGHKVKLDDITNWDTIELETISMSPLVFRIQEFLSNDECELIKELSLPHLEPSGVSLMDEHKGRTATEWRTSTTYFLSSNAHKDLHVIDQRCSDLTKVPISHQEDAQVLRYEKTQKYDAHHDYFNPTLYKKNTGIMKDIDFGYKNRLITVFWYMSDVAKGGETVFPRSGGLPQPRDFKDCETGIKVAPKKRSTIIFYSLLPSGELDPFSLHGGCPVQEGVKFAVNKWVWNKPRE